jgi:hypothetical protein
MQNLTLFRQLGDRLEERERVVTETLRAIMDSIKQLAAVDDDVMKPWWKRLFGQGSKQ